jgi:hypothetical protein
MDSGDVAPFFLNIRPAPFYRFSPWHTASSTDCTQVKFGHSGEQKNLGPPLGIKFRFPGRPLRSLVTIMTELPKSTYHLWAINVVLKKRNRMRVCWLDSPGSRYGPIAESLKKIMSLRDSIRRKIHLEQLSDYQLLNKNSASYFIVKHQTELSGLFSPFIFPGSRAAKLSPEL